MAIVEFAVILKGVLAVAQAVLIGLSGVFLHKQGILPQMTKTHLSQMVVRLFLPALLVRTIGAALTPTKLVNWWPLPVFGAMQCLFGIIFGRLMGRIVFFFYHPETPREDIELRITDVCNCVNNASTLPLVYLEALCGSGSTILSKDLSETECIEYAFAYNALYLIPAVSALFSYASRHLRAPASGDVVIVDSPNVLIGPVEGSPLDDSDGSSKHPFLIVMLRVLHKVPWPIWSILFGIFIGLLEPMQTFLFKPNAPQQIIIGAMSQIAFAAVPLSVILLAANLFDTANSSSASGASSKVSVGIVLLVRLVLVPLASSVIVLLALSLNILNHEKRLLIFVLLLGSAMPPAMNLNTVAQMNGFSHHLLSSTMLASYGASIITTPLWIAVFLKIVKIY